MTWVMLSSAAPYKACSQVSHVDLDQSYLIEKTTNANFGQVLPAIVVVFDRKETRTFKIFSYKLSSAKVSYSI